MIELFVANALATTKNCPWYLLSHSKPFFGYAKYYVSQLQCICCLKLQHYYCYGFALETQVNEHYCYQCLLEDTHETLLGDMKSLAIFRRALWVLYEKHPSSPAEFAQELR